MMNLYTFATSVRSATTSAYTRYQIWGLKRDLRRTIRYIDHLAMTYDCGVELIDHITGGRWTRYQMQYAKILSELHKIDPNCPPASTSGT